MKTPIDATGMGGATVALLNGSQDFEMVDLWIITLNGGAIIRWHSGPMNTPLTFVSTGFAGGVYLAGPPIDRGKLSVKAGLEVATLDMVFKASSSDLINGSPLLPFLRGNGLDGATVILLRAYLPSWTSPITGCVVNFSGRVTSLKDVSRSEATVTVSSWLVLLNVNMGPDVYQAGCLNTHYDADCGLTPSNVAGAITVGGSEVTLPSGLSNPDHFFDKGKITFTSGTNNGLSRGVSTYIGGTFQIAFPLPAPASIGDTFNAVRGCLLSMADCNAQSNLPNFRGQPFIPAAVNGITGLPG